MSECPVCGSADLSRVKCKVSCNNCGTILQTCSDGDLEREDHAASLRSIEMSAFTTKRLIARRSVRELVAEAQVNIDADLARRARMFAIEAQDREEYEDFRKFRKLAKRVRSGS